MEIGARGSAGQQEWTLKLVSWRRWVEREDQLAAVPLVHPITSCLVDRSDLLGQLATMGEVGTADTETSRL